MNVLHNSWCRLLCLQKDAGRLGRAKPLEEFGPAGLDYLVGDKKWNDLCLERLGDSTLRRLFGAGSPQCEDFDSFSRVSVARAFIGIFIVTCADAVQQVCSQ
jgi:hypothetical protein